MTEQTEITEKTEKNLQPRMHTNLHK
jgi:hypothetical protein